MPEKGGMSMHLSYTCIRPSGVATFNAFILFSQQGSLSIVATTRTENNWSRRIRLGRWNVVDALAEHGLTVTLLWI